MARVVEPTALHAVRAEEGDVMEASWRRLGLGVLMAGAAGCGRDIAIGPTGTELATSESAIVNGVPDTKNQYPFVCTLVTDVPQNVPFAELCNCTTFAYCSAVLISPTVAITAAHCVVPAPLGNVGPFFRPTLVCDPEGFDPETSVRYPVEESVAHPGFAGSPDLEGGDIAVLLLEEPVEGVKQFAKLPKLGFIEKVYTSNRQGELNGPPLTVVGYGTTEFFPGFPPPESELRRVGTTEMVDVLPFVFEHGPDPSVVCQQDSGGPVLLARSPIVLGITNEGDCETFSLATRLDTTSALEFLAPYLE
jgi:Trypsin